MYQKLKGHKGDRVRAQVPDPKVVHMLDHCIWDHRSLVLVFHIRYVTRQLFRQFRADQCISKLSIIVTVYQQI